MSEPIYHVVPAEYFYSLPPDQPYVPRDFAREGFIHCTGTAELVPLVANRFLANTPGDFLVLAIDTERLDAPLRWEPGRPPPGYTNPEGTAELLWPHLYGALNRDAIVDIRRLRRHRDGTFEPLERSLTLHPRERDLFLTPRPGDERQLPADARRLLLAFEQAQSALAAARDDLAARLAPTAAEHEAGETAGAETAGAPGGPIGALLRDTLVRMAELDRQIDYFFAHGSLAGYSAPAPAMPAGAAGDDELAQLQASAEELLGALRAPGLDGASERYLAVLALATLSAGFFVARGLPPPPPAKLLSALEAEDAEAAGWARAVLTVASHAELHQLLERLQARAFAKPSAPAPPAPGRPAQPDEPRAAPN